MFAKKQTMDYVGALSRLEPLDYASKNRELDGIYKRLQQGRKAFARVYELNIDAVSKTSELNLEISFYIDQLKEITEDIYSETHDIHLASQDTTEVSGIVSGRHEDLTNTIVDVSEASNEVCVKISSGQDELTKIHTLSEKTIRISEAMQEDMNELADVIGSMNAVIDGINAISNQTNLLSLNASIEAARAGEAGKGFAVVADEIRMLADETKNLTGNMGEFIEKVGRASQKSVESMKQSIGSLQEVDEKIRQVWELNEENQKQVAGISESISTLAAVSEEISSSMNEIESKTMVIAESCGFLERDAERLSQIKDACTKAVAPLPALERHIDDSLVKQGKMCADPFYVLSREELLRYVDGAIAGHKAWVEKLREIIDSHMIQPLQVDHTKCRFGHFFNSLEPPVPELLKKWKEIGEEHKHLHQLGSKILKDLFDEKEAEAEQDFEEAVRVSEQLVGQLEYMKGQIPQEGSRHEK